MILRYIWFSFSSAVPCNVFWWVHIMLLRYYGVHMVTFSLIVITLLNLTGLFENYSVAVIEGSFTGSRMDVGGGLICGALGGWGPFAVSRPWGTFCLWRTCSVTWVRKSVSPENNSLPPNSLSPLSTKVHNSATTMTPPSQPTRSYEWSWITVGKWIWWIIFEEEHEATAQVWDCGRPTHLRVFESEHLVACNYSIPIGAYFNKTITPFFSFWRPAYPELKDKLGEQLPAQCSTPMILWFPQGYCDGSRILIETLIITSVGTAFHSSLPGLKSGEKTQCYSKVGPSTTTTP